MPTPAKQATIRALVAELGRINGAIVTDYRGLDVEELSRLRARLRPLAGRYQVVKNTLLKIALREKAIEGLDPQLEGPTAVLFAEGDVVEATKALMAFIRELRKELPEVKGGLLGARVLTAAEVGLLATLPPREQILATLVGTLQTPVANVVSLIGAVLQNLVGTIEAYQQKQAA